MQEIVHGMYIGGESLPFAPASRAGLRYPFCGATPQHPTYKGNITSVAKMPGSFFRFT